MSNPVQRALAEIAPGFGQAETGPIQPPGTGVISGKDPRHEGAPFVNQVQVGIVGGAATPVTDAFLSIPMLATPACAGSIAWKWMYWVIRCTSCAVALSRTPRARAHSEGPPQSTVSLVRSKVYTTKVLYTADGTINSAMGAGRGGRGALAQAQKRGCDGSLTALPACYGVALEPGEFAVSHSACGGGHGPPFERDPGRVLHDLREGWITAVRAGSVYGVVTTGDAADDTLAVDVAAAQSLRSQMCAAASGPDLTSEA